ncbi:hypothetical protein BDF14DRAFT_1885489 [Spinellus fusiger]|nr:hypothetical protein BDF14DRAFT_1885489 [Spinellus fusiger]
MEELLSDDLTESRKIPQRYYTPQPKNMSKIKAGSGYYYESTPSPSNVIIAANSKAVPKDFCCLGCILACFLCCAVKNEENKSSAG